MSGHGSAAKGHFIPSHVPKYGAVGSATQLLSYMTSLPHLARLNIALIARKVIVGQGPMKPINQELAVHLVGLALRRRWYKIYKLLWVGLSKWSLS
jgi:hypothetical protein